MTEAELHEARLLLPWYANGTLSLEDRRRIDALLAASPDLRAELAWLETVRGELKRSTEAGTDDGGLGELLGRIDVPAEGNVVPIARPARPRWHMPALAIAASLVLVQAVVIGVLVQQPDETLRPLSGPVDPRGVLLQVRFQPQATEAEMRGLLTGIGGELVAGPGALGLYTVRVDTTRAQSARAALAARVDVVESFAVVPR